MATPSRSSRSTGAGLDGETDVPKEVGMDAVLVQKIEQDARSSTDGVYLLKLHQDEFQDEECKLSPMPTTKVLVLLTPESRLPTLLSASQKGLSPPPTPQALFVSPMPAYDAAGCMSTPDSKRKRLV